MLTIQLYILFYDGYLVLVGYHVFVGLYVDGIGTCGGMLDVEELSGEESSDESSEESFLASTTTVGAYVFAL